jgi:flagellar L-ring protein FlgH
MSSRLKKNIGRWLAFMMLTSFCNAIYAESLYREDTYRSLTADNKAFRIGDVLTVQVIENSSASTNAGTTTRRKNNLNADLSLTHNPSISAGVGIGGDFDGGGSVQRAGKVLTQISVTVREVMPNGDLQIAGEQKLLVDNETQHINLEGRVRPQDISPGNVVLSTRLADAKITYMGDGDLAERQKRSAWRQLVDWLGF